MRRQIEVLVIDDNPGDIALIRESFRECSLQPLITSALNADQAVVLLEDPQRELPSLIILDINLPRTSGFEVLQWIRSHQRLNGVPVVIMSSSTLPSEIGRAYDLHASAYIGKPSSLDAYFDIARGIVTLWLQAMAALPAK